MRLLLSLTICLYGSFLSLSLTKHPVPQTFYYFCESRAWSPASIAGKQNIVYTEVQQIFCEEKVIPLRTKEWANYIHANCKNEGGCSSDLNYYYTEQDARDNYSKMLKSFSDTTKYAVSQADFK